MADDRSAVDSYLGKDWYDGWQELMARRAEEEARYAVLADKLGSLASTDGIWGDFKDLESAGDYVDQGMEAIAGGRRVNKTEMDLAFDLYGDAIEIATLNNDLLELIVAAGFFDAFKLLVMFPYHMAERRAQELQQALGVLKKELEKAKQQRNEAWLQGAINLIVTVAVPELGLIIGLAKYVGGLKMDDMLGVEKGKVVSGAGDSIGAFSTFAEAVDKVEKLSLHDVEFVKKAGKAGGAVGVAVDGYEIYKSYQNVDAIRAAMQNVQATAKTLRTFMARYTGAIAEIRRTVAGFRYRAQKNRTEVQPLRSAFRDNNRRLLAIAGGRPWQAVAEPAPVR